MAAAPLRYAARRLLGGRVLQRPRFTQTLTADEKKEATSFVAEIKAKKEELYDLIARCERKYVVDGSTGSENGQLLEFLSHQVEPRPNDPHWRSCHRVTTINNYVHTLGSFCIGFAIMRTFLYLGKQVGVYPQGKESLGSQQHQ